MDCPQNVKRKNLKFVSNILLPIVLIFFLFITLISSFIQNSSTGVLGKDESIYVLNAMGHYEHTSIDEPMGSWIDAVEKGMIRTNDPPGFFFLLHFWEYISFSEIWLRLLPYCFFIISIIYLIRIGILLKLHPFLSVAIGFFPLASRQMVFHSIEIRAYGMEICMTSVVMYYALLILDAVNKKSRIGKYTWFVFSSIMILGLTSRMSFVISATAIYSALFILVYLNVKSDLFREYFLPLSISAVISFLMFILIFFMIFGRKFGVNLPFPSDETILSQSFGQHGIPGTFYQKLSHYFNMILQFPFVFNPGRLYQGFDLIVYRYIICFIALIITYRVSFKFIPNYEIKKSNNMIFVGWVLIILPVFFNKFFINLLINLGYFDLDILSGTSEMLLWLMNIASLLLGFCIIKFSCYDSIIEKTRFKIDLANSGVFLITIFVFILSIMLSYVGLHPFSARGRHSLYLQIFIFIFLISLVKLSIYKLHNHSKTISFIDNQIINGSLVLALVSLSAIYGVLYSSYKIIYRGGGAQHTPEVIKKVVSDMELKKVDYWYISSGEANSFKYHVLHGGLKNKISNKALVTMEKPSAQDRKEVIFKQLNEIYNVAIPGSKIILVTGHTSEETLSFYKQTFFKFFKHSQKTGVFVQSSQNGEPSMGGEQAFYAVR